MKQTPSHPSFLLYSARRFGKISNVAKIAITFLSLVFGLLISLPAFAASPAEEGYKTGRDAFLNNDYATAISKWEETLKNYPTSPVTDPMKADLALAYLLNGKAQNAIDTLSKLMTPPTSDVVRERATFYTAKAYLTMAGTATDNASARNSNLQSAITFYTKLIDGFPNAIARENAFYDRSIANFILERYDLTESDLQMLIKLYPSSQNRADYYFLLSSVYGAKYVVQINQKKSEADLKAALQKALDMLNQTIALGNVIVSNDANLSLGRLYFATAGIDTDLERRKNEIGQAIDAYHKVRPRDELIPVQNDTLKKISSQIAEAAKSGDSQLSERLMDQRTREQSRLNDLSERPDAALQALIGIASCYNLGNRPDEARTLLRRGLSFASRIEDKKEIRYQIILSYALNGAADRASSALADYQKDFPNDTTADDISFRIGTVLMQKKDFQAAYDQFAKSVKDYPKGRFAELATLQQAVCLVSLGKPDQAVQTLSAFVTKNPDNPYAAQAQFKLGEAQIALGKIDDGLKTFRAIAANPKADAFRPLAALQVGSVLYSAGRFDEAIKEFGNFVTTFPQNESAPKASYFIGAAQMKKNDYDGALKTFEKIGDQYPNDPIAMASQEMVGGIYMSQSKFPEMIAAYEKLIQKYPKTVSAIKAHSRLAQYYDRLKNYDDAAKHYAAIIIMTDFPEYASEAQLALASMWQEAAKKIGAYTALKDDEKKDWTKFNDKAEESLVALLQNFPKSEEVGEGLQHLLDLVLLRNQYGLLPDTQAEAYFTTLAGKMNSDDIKLRCQLTQAGYYFEKGNHAKALSAIKDVTSSHPDLTLSRYDYNRWGTALVENKEYDPAIGVFEKLQTSFAKDQYAQADAVYGLGSAYFQKKDVAKAGQYFDVLKKNYPWSSKIMEAEYGLGLASEQSGNSDDAKKHYVTILANREAPGPIAAKSMLGMGRLLEKQGFLIPDPQKDGPNAVAYYYKAHAFYGAATPDLSAEGLYRAAKCYEKAGKSEEAKKTRDELLQNYPKSEWATKP